MALLPSAASFPSAQNFYSPFSGLNQMSATKLAAKQNIYRAGQLENQKYLFEQMMKQRTLQERSRTWMGRSADMMQPHHEMVEQQHDDDDDGGGEDESDEHHDDDDDDDEKEPIEHVAEVGVVAFAYTILGDEDWEMFALTELFMGGLDELKVPSLKKLHLLLAMNYFINQVQLLHSTKPKRYRNVFCRQPLKVGSGHESHTAYFYDSTRDQCTEFTYSGRGGNKNRFEKKRECELRCRTFSPEGQDEFYTIVRENLLLEMMDFLLEEMNVKSFLRCLWNIRMTAKLANRE